MKLDPVSPRTEILQHTMVLRLSGWKGFVLVFQGMHLEGTDRQDFILHLVELLCSLVSISVVVLKMKMASPHSLVSRQEFHALTDM